MDHLLPQPLYLSKPYSGEHNLRLSGLWLSYEQWSLPSLVRICSSMATQRQLGSQVSEIPARQRYNYVSRNFSRNMVATKSNGRHDIVDTTSNDSNDIIGVNSKGSNGSIQNSNDSDDMLDTVKTILVWFDVKLERAKGSREKQTMRGI
ncbi:hypothetical protein PoB_006499700 [Plakobranchus ocellatus]|uniref:Uncharacterized protein n=1 Tax=Plakobranchus ocellatus TaxID=259542 RepID=A0AAV4D2W1_9GAST|nr:hypothetical protein PoB_006499700 [Plakobranchus ocellatus]